MYAFLALPNGEVLSFNILRKETHMSYNMCILIYVLKNGVENIYKKD